MTWLSTLIANICALIIEKLGGDVSSYITKKQAEADAQAAEDAQAKASVQPLKDAVTGDEIDKATDSALNGV